MPSFFGFSFVSRQEVIEAQRKLLLIKERQLNDWKRATLAQARAAQEVALAARLAIESPEIDMRDDFDALLREIGYQVARLEEEVV